MRVVGWAQRVTMKESSSEGSAGERTIGDVAILVKVWAAGTFRTSLRVFECTGPSQGNDRFPQFRNASWSPGRGRVESRRLRHILEQDPARPYCPAARNWDGLRSLTRYLGRSQDSHAAFSGEPGSGMSSIIGSSRCDIGPVEAPRSANGFRARAAGKELCPTI